MGYSSVMGDLTYSEERITITWETEGEGVVEFNPRPYNSLDNTFGAPLADAFPDPKKPKQGCISNILAAKLAINVPERESKLPLFSKTFQNYHKACVQVIATNPESEVKTGSGILVKHSERKFLITSAHVITDRNCSVTIVLEVGHAETGNENEAEATQVKINLEGHRISRNAKDDVAFIFFDNTSAAGQLVLKHVQEFPSLGFPRLASNYFMAIHYGNQHNHKSVSVGERVGTGDHLPLDMSVYLAGSPGASGAPLFNYIGEVVAILRSKNEKFPGQRHFTAFKDIDENFNSDTDCEPRVFEVFEGGKFDEKLLENNGDLEQTVFQCLGVGGLHRKTRKYSEKKKIESDHFPSYNAYDMASKYENCPAVVKSILTGGGDRPGENNLPAIIIPKVIHRKLATTMSSSFRHEQAIHIVLEKFPEAIRKNFDDYFAKGLFRRDNYRCQDDTFDALIENYVTGFVEALQQHQTLRFIQREDRLRLEGYIEALARNGRESGEELDRGDIISLDAE